MSRQPDLILKAMNIVSNEKSSKLGAAWINKDGSISLSLDLGTALISHPDMRYTLFPNDKEHFQDKARQKCTDNLPPTEASTWHPSPEKGTT